MGSQPTADPASDRDRREPRNSEHAATKRPQEDRCCEKNGRRTRPIATEIELWPRPHIELPLKGPDLTNWSSFFAGRCVHPRVFHAAAGNPTKVRLPDLTKVRRPLSPPRASACAAWPESHWSRSATSATATGLSAPIWSRTSVFAMFRKLSMAIFRAAMPAAAAAPRDRSHRGKTSCRRTNRTSSRSYRSHDRLSTIRARAGETGIKRV